MNEEVSGKQKDGEIIRDLEHFRKQYAMVLVQLRDSNDHVINSQLYVLLAVVPFVNSMYLRYVFILRWLQPCFVCGNGTHFMGSQRSHILINPWKMVELLTEHRTHLVTFLVILIRSLDPK